MPHKIRTKFILIFFSIISPFLAVVGLIAIHNRTVLYTGIKRIDYISREMNGFNSIQSALNEIVMPANDYISTGDKKYLKEFESGSQKIEGLLKEVELLLSRDASEPAEDDSKYIVLREATTDWRNVKDISTRIFAIQNPVGNKEAVRLMEEMDYKWSRPAIRKLETWHNIEMKEMREAVDAVDKAWRRNWSIIVGGFAVLMSLALYFVIFYSKRLVQPIKALHEGSETIMNGGLEHRIKINTGDELEQLGNAFNSMAMSLGATLSSLKSQVERYGRLIEMAPEAIILTDPETKEILDVNPAAEKLLGYAKGDISGSAVDVLYPKERLKEYLEAFEKAAGGGKVSLLDAAVLKKDGTAVPVDISASIVKIGEKRFLQGFFRNITERKELERMKEEYTGDLEKTVRERTERLNESVEDLKNSRNAVLNLLEEVESGKRDWEATFDGMRTPLFIHDREFKVIRCNRAYQQLAGRPFGEIINRPYYEVFPRIEEPFKMCRLGAETQEVEDVEEVTVAEQDKIFKVRSFPITDSEGMYRYSIHIMEDITEQKKAEEEIRLKAQLLDSAKDSVFLNDFDGNILYVNKAAYMTRGYGKDELLAMNLHDLDVPEYARLIEPRMKVLMEKGEASFEAAHYRKDRSVMPVDVHVTVIETAGKKLTLGVTRDITERKLADDKIKHETETTKHLLMIAEATAQLTNIDSLMARVVHCVKKILECDICLSYQWDNEAKLFRPVEETGLENALMPYFKTESLTGEASFIKDAFEKGLVILESTAFQFETHLKSPGSGIFRQIKDLDALIIIPLSGKHGHLGILAGIYVKSNSAPVREFTARNKELMHGISNQVSIALEEARLYKESMNKTIELSRKIETIQVMHEIDRSILSTLNSQEIMETVVMMTSRILTADMVTILQLDTAKNMFSYAAGFGLTSVQKGELVPFEDTSLTDIVKTGRSQYVANLKEVKDLPPLERHLLEDGCMSLLRLPLTVKGDVKGILSIGAKRPAAFTQEDLSITEKLSSQISVALENSRLLQDVEDLFISTVRTLSNAIDAKSPWTKGHSERVTKYALDITKELGFDQRQIKTMEIAGLLHDIGKLGTYENILDKNGPLTEEEFTLIRKHPVQGVEILSPIKQLAGVVPGIRCHHESYDGKGYPDGLKGENIPFMARVLAVADAVDAMSADRPYRKGKPMNAIVAELKRCSGTQFDPSVVEAFLRTMQSTSMD